MVFKLQMKHDQVYDQITIYHVQRAVTLKVSKPQLWFLCSVCCPMMVNISVKFSERNLSYFMTKITIYNIQRAITP